MNARAVYLGYSFQELLEIRSMLEKHQIRYRCRAVKHGRKHVGNCRQTVGKIGMKPNLEALYEVSVGEEQYKEACLLMLKYRNSK